MDNNNISENTRSTRSSSIKPVLELSIQLSKQPNSFTSIAVFADSHPELIVEQFINSFQLKPQAFNPILANLLDEMQKLQHAKAQRIFLHLRDRSYYDDLMRSKSILILSADQHQQQQNSSNKAIPHQQISERPSLEDYQKKQLAEQAKAFEQTLIGDQHSIDYNRQSITQYYDYHWDVPSSNHSIELSNRISNHLPLHDSKSTISNASLNTPKQPTSSPNIDKNFKENTNHSGINSETYHWNVRSKNLSNSEYLKVNYSKQVSPLRKQDTSPLKKRDLSNRSYEQQAHLRSQEKKKQQNNSPLSVSTRTPPNYQSNLYQQQQFQSQNQQQSSKVSQKKRDISPKNLPQRSPLKYSTEESYKDKSDRNKAHQPRLSPVQAKDLADRLSRRVTPSRKTQETISNHESDRFNSNPKQTSSKSPRSSKLLQSSKTKTGIQRSNGSEANKFLENQSLSKMKSNQNESNNLPSLKEQMQMRIQRGNAIEKPITTQQYLYDIPQQKVSVAVAAVQTSPEMDIISLKQYLKQQLQYRDAETQYEPTQYCTTHTMTNQEYQFPQRNSQQMYLEPMQQNMYPTTLTSVNVGMRHSQTSAGLDYSVPFVIDKCDKSIEKNKRAEKQQQQQYQQTVEHPTEKCQIQPIIQNSNYIYQGFNRGTVPATLPIQGGGGDCSSQISPVSTEQSPKFSQQIEYENHARKREVPFQVSETNSYLESVLVNNYKNYQSAEQSANNSQMNNRSYQKDPVQQAFSPKKQEAMYSYLRSSETMTPGSTQQSLFEYNEDATVLTSDEADPTKIMNLKQLSDASHSNHSINEKFRVPRNHLPDVGISSNRSVSPKFRGIQTWKCS